MAAGKYVPHPLYQAWNSSPAYIAESPSGQGTRARSTYLSDHPFRARRLKCPVMANLNRPTRIIVNSCQKYWVLTRFQNHTRLHDQKNGTIYSHHQIVPAVVEILGKQARLSFKNIVFTLLFPTSKYTLRRDYKTLSKQPSLAPSLTAGGHFLQCEIPPL